MQVNLNQSCLDEYLSIIKGFMLQMHQRINQQNEICSIQPHLISIIDQASIKIKTQKQEINILNQQLKESQIAKLNYKDIKTQYTHLQKRLNQKVDQISILRETVKTLYQDNERISLQKQALSKEISSLKDNASGLKKKIKKQQEEISNNRQELKKISIVTEDKIAEYLKEDEQKQIIIKKLTSEVQRYRTQASKKQKSLNNLTKKYEDLKNIQEEHSKSIKLLQTLKQQNNFLLNELQNLKQKYFQQKSQYLKQNDNYGRQIQEYKQRIEEYKMENKNLIQKINQNQQNNTNYENQIILRTQKLKEKNKQIKIYNEEINKLNMRVGELNNNYDEIIRENEELNDKCRDLQGQIQEVRAFQNYIQKLKGNINHKKSSELNKLMESLGKLQSHA